jgi:Animal haem peroxidase
MPFLYDRDDPAKLLVGRNDAGPLVDLPRNRQGVALVGDPRNDVHLLMSQLHLAMLHLHNGLVDRLRSDGVAEAELFAEARRAATCHYQWVLLQDFLPRVVGAELAGELLAGGARYYRPDPGAAWIPLEFADAAYRYGHSQVRDRYQVNRYAEPVPLLPDLLGFRPVPAVLVVDWPYLFDLPGRPPAQRAKRIDGRLAASLIRLPAAVTGVGSGDDYASLAIRDLQRGQGSGCRPGRRWPAASGSSRSPPRRSALARPAGGGRRRSGSTYSRRPSTAAGASAWARWAAGWSARCWSASSTPTARATGPSTPAGVPPCPPPRRGASAWPTCWPSAPRSPGRRPEPTGVTARGRYRELSESLPAPLRYVGVRPIESDLGVLFAQLKSHRARRA